MSRTIDIADGDAVEGAVLGKDDVSAIAAAKSVG